MSTPMFYGILTLSHFFHECWTRSSNSTCPVPSADPTPTQRLILLYPRSLYCLHSFYLTISLFYPSSFYIYLYLTLYSFFLSSHRSTLSQFLPSAFTLMVFHSHLLPDLALTFSSSHSTNICWRTHLHSSFPYHRISPMSEFSKQFRVSDTGEEMVHTFSLPMWIECSLHNRKAFL